MLEARAEDRVIRKLPKPNLEAGCKVIPIVHASCGVGRMANIIEVGRPKINVTEMGEKLNLKGIPVVVLPVIEFKTSTINCDENHKDGKISEYFNKDNTIKEEIMDFEYHVLDDYKNLSFEDSGCDLEDTIMKEEVDIDEDFEEYLCTKFSCSTCGENFSSHYSLRRHSVSLTHIRNANQKKNKHTIKNWSSNPLNASTVPLVNADPEVSMSVLNNETELLSNLLIVSTDPSVNADPEACCVSVVNNNTELVPISPNALTFPSVNADPAISISDLSKELEILPNLPNCLSWEAIISVVNKKIELLPNPPNALTIPSVNSDPEVYISLGNKEIELLPNPSNELSFRSIIKKFLCSTCEENFSSHYTLRRHSVSLTHIRNANQKKNMHTIKNWSSNPLNASAVPLVNADPEVSMSVLNNETELLSNLPIASTVPSVNADPEVCCGSVVNNEIELVPISPNALTVPSVNADPVISISDLSTELEILPNLPNSSSWDASISVFNKKIELLPNPPNALTIPSVNTDHEVCISFGNKEIELLPNPSNGLSFGNIIGKIVSKKAIAATGKIILETNATWNNDTEEQKLAIRRFRNKIISKFNTNPFKCSKCDYASARRCNLAFHINSVHKKLQCSKCNYSCRGEYLLLEHITTKHDSSALITCKKCDFSCATIDKLTAHSLSFHESKELKCSQCEFLCNNKQELIEHILSIHENLNKIKCLLCDFTCSMKFKLTGHMLGVHLANVKKCPYCDSSYSWKRSLVNHMLKSHKVKINKNFECKYCGFLGKTDYLLHTHYVKEHNDSSYQFNCSKCDFVGDFPSLQFHGQSVHKKFGSFNCSRCNLVFTNKHIFINHIMAVHERFKPFKCSQCSFSAIFKHQVITHVLAVHLKTKNVHCPDCDYTCTTTSLLYAHARAAHEKLKAFKCILCDYATTRSNYLTLHIKSVHDKSREFKCPHCNHSTCRKDNLKAHIARIHKINHKLKSVESTS